MITSKQTEKAIIDRILYYQERRGTPDVRLFTVSKMSRPTWKARLRGEGSFTIRELIAISDVLGVKLSDIIAKSELSVLERAS